MNPRVSRSSALACKATGFPIAKIAAKLAVGYTLDEIPNDITRETPACFEPTIDYVVVKIPRFTFEKFPRRTDVLDHADEVGRRGDGHRPHLQGGAAEGAALAGDRRLRLRRQGPRPARRPARRSRRSCACPNARRLWYVADAYRAGHERPSEIFDADARSTRGSSTTSAQIVDVRERSVERSAARADRCARAKAHGLLRRPPRRSCSDRSEEEVAPGAPRGRHRAGATRRVDTCAAEFEAYTPYLYSTYEDEDESGVTARKKIMILGGGPNRIGQGIEFDYCCVHAAFALREAGYETIMVNCNPETVSTDYDTSDQLYFEPLTREDVLSIVEREKPDGVIVQFGGQTPLKLAVPLEEAGVPIIGTSPDAIDRAEDRERFAALLDQLGLRQPRERHRAHRRRGGRASRARIGYPVLVRPSYVLGGRAMEIVYDEDALRALHGARRRGRRPDRPVLIDKFLEDAIEVDVDAISDGETRGHRRHHGAHRAGRRALGRQRLRAADQVDRRAGARRRSAARSAALALELGVDRPDERAVRGQGRTTSTSSRSIRAPRAPCRSSARRSACRWPSWRRGSWSGETLRGARLHRARSCRRTCAVKEAVFPFAKFPGVDTLLGPEMKSTGEVMGIDASFGVAFAKAQIAAGTVLPPTGTVFLSVRDEDKAGRAAGRAAAGALRLRPGRHARARRPTCARTACRSRPSTRCRTAARTSSTPSAPAQIADGHQHAEGQSARTWTRSPSAAARSSAACRTSPPSPAPRRPPRASSCLQREALTACAAAGLPSPCGESEPRTASASAPCVASRAVVLRASPGAVIASLRLRLSRGQRLRARCELL